MHRKPRSPDPLWFVGMLPAEACQEQIVLYSTGPTQFLASCLDQAIAGGFCLFILGFCCVTCPSGVCCWMENELFSHVSFKVQIGELRDCHDRIGKVDTLINRRGEGAVYRKQTRPLPVTARSCRLGCLAGRGLLSTEAEAEAEAVGVAMHKHAFCNSAYLGVKSRAER